MLLSRRKYLEVLSAAVLQRVLAAAPTRSRKAPRSVVLITLGGIRRQESFSSSGQIHIPHLANDLMPQSLFYPYTINEGVTSHFNSIASVLTGIWQHVDDWGSEKAPNPTLFQYLQKETHVGPEETWVVTSNKQLTANIGPDANVILCKQLMIEAVERIIKGQTSRTRLEREQLLKEMTSVLETDYERIGWGVPSESVFRNPQVKDTLISALTDFIHGPGASVTGDELTLIVAREVLSRIGPALLMVNFSDMEVAHSGTYSLHLGGIHKADLLCHRLWQFIDADPELRQRTTLIIMNEFGRDPDGSGTNGFFNHRTDTECCRMSWTMVLGQAVKKPEVVQRVVRQIDLTPSIASWMGFECGEAAGIRLPEFNV